VAAATAAEVAATATTGVAATSASTVLRESGMRSEGEKCGERQRGEEVPGSTRVLRGVATVSRARKKRTKIIAILDAGKLAPDCADFCTTGPLGHFTLLAAGSSEGEATA
jgi:hypothetical protein